MSAGSGTALLITTVTMVVTFIIRTDLVTLLSLSVSTMPFFTVRYVMYGVTIRVMTNGTPCMSQYHSN